MSTDTIAAVRRWAGDSQRWLTAFLAAVPADDSILAVIAIGSAVRERGHRRSDFDLLVIYRRKRPVIDAPLEVDIRFVALDEIDSQMAKGHEILCWAVAFGTALHDPQRHWTCLQERWGDRIPLPSAKEARLRGQESLARAAEMLQIDDESAADDLILAALTQFVREDLINAGVFPASRPELPNQLRNIDEHHPLAKILEDALYGDSTPSELLSQLEHVHA